MEKGGGEGKDWPLGTEALKEERWGGRERGRERGERERLKGQPACLFQGAAGKREWAELVSYRGLLCMLTEHYAATQHIYIDYVLTCGHRTLGCMSTGQAHPARRQGRPA